MNIKQLEIFTSIVATGSFSKGADAACITQSTASQHIATLEEACGVRLLDRAGRGVLPTEAGKVLFAHAQQVLKTLKGAQQAMLQFRRADGVELSVGGSTIPGTYLLPGAIATLRATDPGITVRVLIGDSSEVLEKLLTEDVEIGVIGKGTDDRRFSSETLGADEILLVGRKGDPWSDRADIRPEELLTMPLIMREKGSGTADVVTSALMAQGISADDLKVSACLASSEAIKQGVLAGCGGAFISKMAVCEELKHGKIVQINVAGLKITRSFYLVQRRGRALSPAAAAFSLVLRRNNTEYGCTRP